MRRFSLVAAATAVSERTRQERIASIATLDDAVEDAIRAAMLAWKTDLLRAVCEKLGVPVPQDDTATLSVVEVDDKIIAVQSMYVAHQNDRGVHVVVYGPGRKVLGQLTIGGHDKPAEMIEKIVKLVRG